jgi:phage-related minor tail protein
MWQRGWGEAMADLRNASIVAQRAADVLLQCAGGRSVLLRMPALATPGDATEQLGLATPTFQDVGLAPVVFRKARATTAEGKAAKNELMVSATSVNALVGSLGYSAGSVLFAVAFGVLIDGVLMEVESATTSEVGGAPYVYRLLLRAPLALAV